jgi:hypothetical protein
MVEEGNAVVLVYEIRVCVITNSSILSAKCRNDTGVDLSNESPNGLETVPARF